MRNGVCLCGLRLAAHFDRKNRKLSCKQAAARMKVTDETDARLIRRALTRALSASKGR
jgi:hypothetical protein